MHPNSRLRDAMVERIAESLHHINFPLQRWHQLSSTHRMAWEREAYQLLDALDHAGLTLTEKGDDR